jgi:molybdenum-dependent DNA-binding transcriptional regulator ModE
MVNLHWEMSVLSRSVAYPNLSAAAAHVGLSQPQLSRIVSRLESEFQLQLLDRAARRKSGWTAAAFKLAEVYANSERKLEGEIHKLVKAAEPQEVRMGTLEGLSPLASRLCHTMLRETSVSVARLDVHDLNVLEELFLSGEIDLLLTSREPGRKKFKFQREVGYQELEQVRTSGGAGLHVYSPFEYGVKLGARHPEADRVFVSNSLDLRKTWIRQFGGAGIIPSEVKSRRPSHDWHAVLLIGSDTLSPTLWKELAKVPEKESRN